MSDHRAGNTSDVDSAILQLLEESLMKITILGMENERLSSELSALQRNQYSNASEMEVKYSQSQLACREKERNNESLQSTIADKNKQIELLQQHNLSLEKQLMESRNMISENITLKNRVDTLEINQNQFSNIDKEREVEITRLRGVMKENENLNRKILDLESRVKFVTSANDKLNKLVSERASEVKNWQTRLNDANNSAAKIPELESKVRLLIIENERLEKEVVSYTEKFIDNEKRLVSIPELENRIRLLATENERLQNI